MKLNIKSLQFAVFILSLFSISAFPCAQTEPSFKKEGRLEFINPNSHFLVKTIDIEIADNGEERAKGLMWRQSMEDNQGMLFIYEKERLLSFWMKNTYFPLDVIFIDKSRRIISIYPQTIPQNEASVFSDKPAQYVIEVVAGFCDQYGISEGDQIRFQKIKY